MLERYPYLRTREHARIPAEVFAAPVPAEAGAPDMEKIIDLIKVRSRPPAITTAATYPIAANIQPVIILNQ